jgi:hypothetical protein
MTSELSGNFCGPCNSSFSLDRFDFCDLFAGLSLGKSRQTHQTYTLELSPETELLAHPSKDRDRSDRKDRRKDYPAVPIQFLRLLGPLAFLKNCRCHNFN